MDVFKCFCFVLCGLNTSAFMIKIILRLKCFLTLCQSFKVVEVIQLVKNELFK